MLRKESSTRIYERFFGSSEKSELPIELILMIFSYFKPNEIPVLTLVNAAWNQLANNDALWCDRFKNRYSDKYDVSFAKDNTDWRMEFQQANKCEKAALILKELNQYIADNTSPLRSEKLTAAQALKYVAFEGSPKSILAYHSSQYTQGALKNIVEKMQQLKLIDLTGIHDHEDDGYGYGRPHYS